MSEVHLTDEEFASCLAEPETEETAALHLRTCAACRAELEDFQAAVTSFNQVSFAWSERRSVTLPTTVTEKAGAGWASKWAWGAATAMLLVLVCGGAVQTRYAGRKEAQATARVDQNSEASISRDNELMTAVDAEIRRKDPSPLVAENEAELLDGQAKTPRSE